MQKFFNKYKKKIYALCIFIFWFTLFLGLRWNSFTVPFDRDEGGYTYIAQRMMQGDLPYNDIFDGKPPLIYYTYTFFQMISTNPYAYWIPRIFSLLSLGITNWVLFSIARKEFGERVSYITLFLFPFIILHPVLIPYSANTETFLLLPLMLSVFLYVMKRESKSDWPWVLLGILVVISILYKPTVLFVTTILVIMWVKQTLSLWGAQKVIRRLWYFSSVSLITTILITYPLLLHDLGKEMFEIGFNYNRAYVEANHNFENLGIYLKEFFKYWFVLVVLSLLFAIKSYKKVSLYFLFLLLTLFPILGTNLGYYFLITAPFITLIFAYSIDIFFSKIQFKKKQNELILRSIVSSIIIASVVGPFIYQLALSPRKINSFIYGDYVLFDEAPFLAEKIKEITKKDEFVFLFSNDPQVLAYSERKSPSRFIYFVQLAIPSSNQDTYQEEVLKDITNKRPKIIVYDPLVPKVFDTNAPVIMQLTHIIESQYKVYGMITKVDGITEWKDVLDEEDRENIRMVIYIRDASS